MSFSVLRTDSELNHMRVPIRAWLKILRLSCDMRGRDQLALVVSKFENFLKCDTYTLHWVDLRWARVLVECADLEIIPSHHWYKIYSVTSQKFIAKIFFVLDGVVKHNLSSDVREPHGSLFVPALDLVAPVITITFALGMKSLLVNDSSNLSGAIPNWSSNLLSQND